MYAILGSLTLRDPNDFKSNGRIIERKVVFKPFISKKQVKEYHIEPAMLATTFESQKRVKKAKSTLESRDILGCSWCSYQKHC